MKDESISHHATHGVKEFHWLTLTFRADMRSRFLSERPRHLKQINLSQKDVTEVKLLFVSGDAKNEIGQGSGLSIFEP